MGHSRSTVQLVSGNATEPSVVVVALGLDQNSFCSEAVDCKRRVIFQMHICKLCHRVCSLRVGGWTSLSMVLDELSTLNNKSMCQRR